MAYYDRIADQWHEITGFRGGAMKEFLLNDLLLVKLQGIEERSILEIGAGNGYFMPLVLDRFSGQTASRIVITDQSEKLLDIAQRYFRVCGAEYLTLDIRNEFPFAGEAFDLIIATMVFNEVSNGAMSHALGECRRVLRPKGRLVVTVLHPSFVGSLSKRGLLKRDSRRKLTMPGTRGVRLPVVHRSVSKYRQLLNEASFTFDEEDIFPTEKVLNAKPGLRDAGDVPVALVYTSEKTPPV